MKTKYLLFALTPVLALTLLAASATYADTETNKTQPFTDIADAIAKKFGLKTADVQSVIDETMVAHRAQMDKNRPCPENMLKQAVIDGKITQAQADIISAKLTEMKKTMEGLKDADRTKIHETMQAQRDALKQWAKDNNIPEQYLMFMGGPMGRGGMGKMMKLHQGAFTK